MKPLIVFDLDGTLADCQHRLHYIRNKPKRFDKFHNACDKDTIINHIADVYRKFHRMGVTLVVMSGRDDAVRDKTISWFKDNNLPLPDRMFLKKGDQFVPDVEMKRRLADRIEREYGRKIDLVFEDRDRVVKMWVDRGTRVFDVVNNRVIDPQDVD